MLLTVQGRSFPCRKHTEVCVCLKYRGAANLQCVYRHPLCSAFRGVRWFEQGTSCVFDYPPWQGVHAGPSYTQVLTGRGFNTTLQYNFFYLLCLCIALQVIPRLNPVYAPSASYVSEDRGRLLLRLDMYGLQERQVQGDGNCQVRGV